jgi:putative serine protease PepD
MSKHTTKIALGATALAAVVAASAATYTLAPRTTTVVQQVAASGVHIPVAATASKSINDIYKGAYKGVVEITVNTTATSSSSPFSPGDQVQQAQGSGFVYDTSGDIVTNAHVVSGANSISVAFWNGTKLKAKLVGSDPSTDLAVIKVDSAPSGLLSPETIGDSGKLVVGEGVVAIGSPFGLDETVTAGIVSQLNRQIDSPNGYAISGAIQTDAAVNHGNSGGPLLNTAGEVVGVNSQIDSDSGGNDGIAFAIASDTVKQIVPQLIQSGSVQHAFLGVSLTDSGTGVTIGTVKSGTPAATAGLQAGDVITQIDGKSVETVGDVTSAIDAKKPGDTVSITYTRSGTSHTVQVKLAARPA